jgi:hypothetical protein
MNPPRTALSLLSILTTLTLAAPNAHAWVYAEHREIMAQAIRSLPEPERKALIAMWSSARTGRETRLNADPVGSSAVETQDLDLADWPALAGDHSTSATDLLRVALETDWVLEVASVSRSFAAQRPKFRLPNELINFQRKSDLALQRADHDYLDRASSNNAHFLLALRDVQESFEAYLARCASPESEINVVSVYLHYHSEAIRWAKRAHGESSKAGASARVNRFDALALANESFAIHFLQDAYAAGHVAGTWGDASQRKGTHDYYNEKGLKTSRWDGEPLLLQGDTWMSGHDTSQTAELIRESLSQVVKTRSGSFDPARFQLAQEIGDGVEKSAWDIRLAQQSPATGAPVSSLQEAFPHLRKLPVPGLIEGLGESPRFRAELGPFFGASAGVRGSLLQSGFAKSQSEGGSLSGLEATVRFGFGLDGVLNEGSDGLAFLGVGYRQDGSSSNSFVSGSNSDAFGALASAIPARSAMSIRARVPFYLLPGDLLILGPIFALIDPLRLQQVAVVAVNGGLLPWQSGIMTPIGRFQFVLGRELAVYLFGMGQRKDALVVQTTDMGGTPVSSVISYRSTQYEFPFLEYRPGRFFSSRESASFLIQFYGGIDRPHSLELELPQSGAILPQLRTVWYGGVRAVLDWRHYL